MRQLDPLRRALAAGVLALSVLTTPAFAERPGASATATAHALDELANAIAQGKITRTPTPTSTPAPTATPAPPSPPTPASPSPTPSPGLPVPASDTDPVAGYLRPSLRQDGQTLELALPQGRWDVRFTEPDCLAPWTNVELEPNAIVQGAADPWPACDLAGASWSSNAPCAVDEDGACDVLADDSYWDMLGQSLPTETPAPTPTPTGVRAAVSPRPTTPASSRPAAPAVERVVETVVVTATAAPTELATPTPSPSPSPTIMASRTPTRTPSPLAAPAVTPRLPLLGAGAQVGQAAAEHWDWGVFTKAIAALLIGGLLVGWLLTRRRVAQWRPRGRSVGAGGAPHHA